MPAPRDTRRPAGARSGRTSAPDLGAASRANTPAGSPRGTQRPSFPRRESESRLEKRVRASLSPGGWDRSPAPRPGALLGGLRGQADLREGAGRSRTQRPPRRAARCAPGSGLRAPGLSAAAVAETCSRLLLLRRLQPGVGERREAPVTWRRGEGRRGCAPAEGALSPGAGGPGPAPRAKFPGACCALCSRRAARVSAAVLGVIPLRFPPRVKETRNPRSRELSALPKVGQRAV